MDIKDNKDFLDAILNALAEGVLVIDRQLRIVLANEEYLKQKHVALKGTIGKYCYEVSRGFDRPCPEVDAVCECPVMKTFTTGEPSKTLHTHRDKDGGEIYVSIKAYPIKDISGRVTYVVETLYDITEKKNANDELQKRVKELENFYDMAIGRELKMTELKDEIERLKTEINALKKTGHRT